MLPMEMRKDVGPYEDGLVLKKKKNAYFFLVAYCNML